MNPKSVTFLSINLIGLFLNQFFPFAQIFGVGPFTFLTAIFLEYFGLLYYGFFAIFMFLELIPLLPFMQNFAQGLIDKYSIYLLNVNQITILMIAMFLFDNVLALYVFHRALHKVHLFNRISMLR